MVDQSQYLALGHPLSNQSFQPTGNLGIVAMGSAQSELYNRYNWETEKET